MRDSDWLKSSLRLIEQDCIFFFQYSLSEDAVLFAEHHPDKFEEVDGAAAIQVDFLDHLLDLERVLGLT